MRFISGHLEIKRLREKCHIVIEDYTKCHYCKSIGLTQDDTFCPNCGFPQRGTQTEMRNFIWNIRNKKLLLKEQKKAINKGRNILFILAGLNLLFGIVLIVTGKINISVILGIMISAVIYFGLGIWSMKNPFPAILTGFFIYIVLSVIGAINDPKSILNGIIIKAFIIFAFIYAYLGVKDAEKLEKELESIKKAKDLNIENDM
ncbi:MAG: hypothetical protein Q8880_02440 [Bacteroidota bacterium]|nr:hypothetical protein [Bacteroidota bacterium]